MAVEEEVGAGGAAEGGGEGGVAAGDGGGGVGGGGLGGRVLVRDLDAPESLTAGEVAQEGVALGAVDEVEAEGQAQEVLQVGLLAFAGGVDGGAELRGHEADGRLGALGAKALTQALALGDQLFADVHQGRQTGLGEGQRVIHAAEHRLDGAQALQQGGVEGGGAVVTGLVGEGLLGTLKERGGGVRLDGGLGLEAGGEPTVESLGQTTGELVGHQALALLLGLAELGLEFRHLAGELGEVEVRRGAVGLGLEGGLVLGGLGLGARLLMCGTLVFEFLAQSGDFAALPGGGVACGPETEAEFFLERGLGLLGRRQGGGLGQPGLGGLADGLAVVLQRGQGDLAAAKAGHQRGAVGFDGLGREGAEQGGGSGAPPQALGQGPMVGLEAGTIVRGERGADDPLLGVLAEAGAQGLGGRGEVGQRRAAELRQEGLEGLPQIVLGEGGGRVRHGSANGQRWARRRWYSNTRRRIRRPGSGSRGHWR